MANILICCSGNKIGGDSLHIFPFYEGLMNALSRNGNNVSYIIINEFVRDYNSRTNELLPQINTYQLNDYLKNKNFDLIICFNNVSIRGFLQNSDIPYIIWGVDPISVYADKNEILKNVDRYIFAGNNEEDCDNIKKFFNPKNLEVLRFATDIRTENIPQDFAISFLGSLWNGSEKELLKRGMSQSTLHKIISLLKNDTNLSLEKIKNTVGKSADLLDKTDVFWLLNGIATSDRCRVLSGLTSLGLHAFGLSEKWVDIADTNLELACCYSSDVIYSMEAVQKLYNRSKINFSMSHVHARGKGFSFRVIDAMASNGCLVTDYKEVYKQLFGLYVDLPTFEYGNQNDARKVCEYILNHEDERLDIVKASNKAIDEGFRFEHRMMQIEKMTGVKLFSNNVGSIIKICSKDFFVVQKKSEITNVQPIKRKAKKSILKKILDFPARLRVKSFKKIYEKYFNQLPVSMETGFNFCDKRFKDVMYRIDHGLTNPVYQSYHNIIFQESYLLKCARKIARPQKSKIRVVFLFQEASYWSSVESLYKNLKSDPKFEVFVVAIPILFPPDLNRLELKIEQINFLKDNNIDYINACENEQMFDVYILKPDYVFLQIHFDRQRILQYKSFVMRLYTKVCIVPHAFLLSASDYKELSHMQDYFRIFVPNNDHAKILSNVLHTTNNIEITGFPRFDLYNIHINDSSIWKISKSKNPNIKRIIWSPHWWIYGASKNCFDITINILMYFIKFLELHENIELIIKPHPSLLNGIVSSGFMSKTKIDELFLKINKMPNASIYTGGNYFDLFKTADLCVNNSISFLAEWLPTEKPMIFVDTDRMFELNNLGNQLLNVYYHVHDIVTLDEKINDLIFNNNDTMKNERLVLLNQLDLISQNASLKIKNSLIRHLNDAY